ncbi:hypothetical protein [Spirosoma pulveris]
MKLTDVAMYLVYIATYCIVIPMAMGMYRYALLPKSLRLLLAGQFVVFGLDLLLLLFDLKATVTFLYLFSAVDAVLMAWVFSSLIPNRQVAKGVWLGAGLLVLLIGVDAFFLSGLTNNGFSHAVEKVYVLLLALYYLTQLVGDDTEDDLAHQPMFWVSGGVVAYNLVGWFDVFSGPIVNYSQTLYLQYYMIWSIITVWMYAAFTYAFWLTYRSQ